MLRMAPLHLALAVADMDRSVAWYGEVLGFMPRRRGWDGALGAEVAFLHRDGFELELFCRPGAAPLPAARRHPDSDLGFAGTKHLCFKVADYGVALAHFKALGVHIPLESETMRLFFVQDPDGILVEFMQDVRAAGPESLTL